MVDEKDIQFFPSTISPRNELESSLSRLCVCLICESLMVNIENGVRCEKCDRNWTHEEMIRDCDFILEGKSDG